MKAITDYIRNKIQKVRQGQISYPPPTGVVNMTRNMVDPKRVLILPYNRMGTLLLATRVFKTLRDHYPNAEISVATHDTWSVLIQRDPTINTVVTFEDYIENPSSREFKLLGKKLAEMNFDLAFFLSYQYDREMAYLARLSEADIRVSFSTGREGQLFNVEIVPAPGIQYEVDRYLEMFRTLGINGDIRDYTMTVSESIMEKARMRYLPAGPVSELGRIVGYDLTREIVGEPVGRKTAEHIIGSLASGLGATVIVFFAPGQKTLAAELKESFGKDIILVEDRPVSMMAGVMGYCRFIVAHNTDLFQLSVALKIPTVAIYSKEELAQWSPGESDTIVHVECPAGSWPSKNVILQNVKKILRQTKKQSN